MLLQNLFLASTASATCLHNLQMFKRADDASVPISTFGYTGINGPLNWAALSSKNLACKTGKNQSPINLDNTTSLAKFKPKIDIPEQEFEFENLGSTIEVVVNGTTNLAGANYRLRQFHFHTPSEHRIGEEYFPLEAHFVHEGVANSSQIAVLTVLFNLDSDEKPTPLVKGLVPAIAAIRKPGTKTTLENLNFKSVVKHLQTTDLFQYSGSLTTPPCAEGVTFLIAKEPLPIDVRSYNAIKRVVKFNSRYTQNTLGQENLIIVGGKAGTSDQVVPSSSSSSSVTARATTLSTATSTRASSSAAASSRA